MIYNGFETFLLFQYIPEWLRVVCRSHKNISKYYRHFILFDPRKKNTRIHLYVYSTKTTREDIFLQLQRGFSNPSARLSQTTFIILTQCTPTKAPKNIRFFPNVHIHHCFPFIYTMCLGYFLVRSRIRNK